MAEKTSITSQFIQPTDDNDSYYMYPQPHRHRVIPFDIPNGRSSKSTSSKFGYQSINESAEDNRIHDQDYYGEQHPEGGVEMVGDEYLLGPRYDQDDPDGLQAPPPDDIGTFAIGDAERYKKQQLYPPAIPKKNEHDLHPMRICLYFAAFLLVVGLFYAVKTLTTAFTCLGPPYLYITHKGSKNILKFSRDGCLIHEKVLWGVAHEQADLRGMIVGKYHGGEALYVADSANGESGVLLYGQCFESTSLRPYLDRVVDYHMNEGANHAYGVAIDELTGDIYASFQDTDVILRFQAETFDPLPLNPGLKPFFLSEKKNKTGNSKYWTSSKKVGWTTFANARVLMESKSPVQMSDSDLANIHVGDPQEEREEEEEEEEIAREMPHLVKAKSAKTPPQKTRPLAAQTGHHGLHLSQHGRPAAATGQHGQHLSQHGRPATGTGAHPVHQHRHRHSSSKSSKSIIQDTDHRFLRIKQNTENGHQGNDGEGKEAAHNSSSVDTPSDGSGQSNSNVTNSEDNFMKKENESAHEEYTFYPGTFVQFGKPGVHVEKERGVRSIIWTKNFTELWIANENLDSIIIVNRTGHLTGKISVGKPIGLHYSNVSHADWVFAGSKGVKTGQVYAIDIFTRTIAATFKYIGMKHPAGITSYNDVLFVGDQTRNSVVTFNITTQRLIKLIIPAKRIDGQIEQLMMSDC